MARSTYVYVVMGNRWPVAGFTVKKEMVAWLSRHKQMPVTLYRLRDGAWNDTSAVDITEEVLNERT